MVGNMDQFRFKKSLGQNFLRDKNILNKIINSSNISSNSLIIEIGPGDGSLTEYLLKTGNNVLAFEIDQRLKEPLELLVKQFPNFEVVFEDFLKVDVDIYLDKYSY